MFHKRRLRLLSVEVPRVNSNIGQILFTIHYISILQKLLFFFFLLFFLETKSVTRSLPHSVTHGDQVHWCDCHFTQASRWGKAAILRLDKIHGRRQPWCPGWSSASRWCSLWVAGKQICSESCKECLRQVMSLWKRKKKRKKKPKRETKPNITLFQNASFSLQAFSRRQYFKVTFLIPENASAHCLHNILMYTGWDQMAAEWFFGDILFRIRFFTDSRVFSRRRRKSLESYWLLMLRTR